ncbi:hypothetical protein FRC14_006260 [Serendipita sp. 396]|nr:hypothetical protein FRC14_006260 [Serendipita sp. 396]KAG8789624.1 hypothetical protein FRC15_006356 [Serendipita sp. 397]KAG8804418.1 hypothetical protein FRC16_008940 [Serendipita sp. 398]KAG8839291.1 hypothetical protein FRC18_011998 [Serendipita sp. 400]KAG8878099.1 hypothetical protein FRC20_009384 [Serendipita sp. 405]
MSDNQVLVVETPLVEIGCTLGEGPLYDPSTDILHFVDINRQRVYHYNNASQSLDFDEVEEPVTALSLRRCGEGLACVTATGFAIIEPGSDNKSVLRHLSKPLSERELRYTRLNDGACDARGRFLAATLESKAPGNEFGGVLYQYDPQTGVSKVLDDQGFTDGNGLGWSEDNATLFFTDSCNNIIHAYDYNIEDGSISNRRPFVNGPSLGLNAPSFCDGLCFDDEGCIWSARWAGSKIVRFSRDGTSILFEIQFPKVFSVTACCFGGPNNDQLFVTTAHPSAANVEDPDKVFEQYPDSGHLYKIDFQGRFKGGAWRHAFDG